MSIPTVLIIVALVLALVDELRARGQSLIDYAVILIAVALLWGRLG
jgi:hypothetical protein